MPTEQFGLLIAAELTWIDIEGPADIDLGLAAPLGVNVEEISSTSAGRRSKRYLVDLGGLAMGRGEAAGGLEYRLGPALSEEVTHDVGKPGGWHVFGSKRPLGLNTPMIFCRSGIEYVWYGGRSDWLNRSVAVGASVGIVIDQTWGHLPQVMTLLPHVTFGSLRLPGGGELALRVSALPPPPSHVPHPMGDSGMVLLSILFTPR
jgi:hypothetical protein